MKEKKHVGVDDLDRVGECSGEGGGWLWMEGRGAKDTISCVWWVGRESSLLYEIRFG